MKVEGYKPIHGHSCINFYFFEVKIDGKKTWCVWITYFQLIVIHWHAGGSRYFTVKQFVDGKGNLCEWLEENLESLPMLEDYDWDKHKETETIELELAQNR